MKRKYFYLICLSISLTMIVVGIVGIISIKKYEKIIGQVAEKNINENSILTDSEEEKVSPNARFALKKYYDDCNHFEYEEVELPKELVNLTQQEVEDYYDDWSVEKFDPNDIVLYKEIDGFCSEHFVLKLDGDNVVVYNLDTNGNARVYKKTDISKQYLTEEDIQKLKKGIIIYGKGKISSALEDFE